MLCQAISALSEENPCAGIHEGLLTPTRKRKLTQEMMKQEDYTLLVSSLRHNFLLLCYLRLYLVMKRGKFVLVRGRRVQLQFFNFFQPIFPYVAYHLLCSFRPQNLPFLSFVNPDHVTTLLTLFLLVHCIVYYFQKWLFWKRILSCLFSPPL